MDRGPEYWYDLGSCCPGEVAIEISRVLNALKLGYQLNIGCHPEDYKYAHMTQLT